MGLLRFIQGCVSLFQKRDGREKEKGKEGSIMEKKLPTENMILDRLPKDIMVGILSRLPITCLVRSMLVCRAWRSLIKEYPPFVSEHLSRCVADMDPIFIVQGDDRCYFTDLSDPSYSQGTNVISMKPLNLDFESSSLVDSCNGLLCMMHYINSRPRLYICNPFTKHYLNLPNPKFIGPLYRNDFNFGYHPTTKEYKVVAVLFTLFGGYTEVEVHVLTVGSRVWRKIAKLPRDEFAFWEWKVKMNGRLHWLSWNMNIVSLDFATEQFEKVPRPNYCGKAWGWHLMVLRGCLSASCYNEDRQLEIWVMKEYGVKESWVKELIIGTTLNHFVVYPRVVCFLKSGDILLYNCKECVYVYDQRHGKLVKKDLRFPQALAKVGLPLGRIVSHVGSLNWLDTPITY